MDDTDAICGWDVVMPADTIPDDGRLPPPVVAAANIGNARADDDDANFNACCATCT